MQLTKKAIVYFKFFFFLTLCLALCYDSYLLNRADGRVEENIIDIWDVTTNGLTVSVFISESLPTLVTSGQTFFLTVLYGNGTTWDAAIVCSYDPEANITIHYMFGDPFNGPYFWSVGSDDMVDIYGQLVEITFLEISAYNSGTVEIAALALTSVDGVQDFLQSFAQTMSDYSYAFTIPISPAPIGTIILPPQTSSELETSNPSPTSVALPSSVPPPAFINITDGSSTTKESLTNEKSTSGTTSSGFDPLGLLLMLSLIFLIRKQRRSDTN